MNRTTSLGKPGNLLLVLAAILAMSSFTGDAYASGDAINGKKLFDKSQCQKCHGTEVFTREERKVDNVEALEKQVRLCDSQLSVNWFDDEISDVVAYLNETYYKFPKDSDNKPEE